jgi:hypothetical protein
VDYQQQYENEGNGACDAVIFQGKDADFTHMLCMDYGEWIESKCTSQADRIKELEDGIRDYGIEVSGRKILLASNVFKRLCKLLTPTKDR